MQSRLLWKLLGVNVTIIGAVILIVWMAFDHLAADYFMTLMERYAISPTEIHAVFLQATHRTLIWASLAAIALAGLLSYLLTSKVLSPLTQMIGLTKRIAAADYSEKVALTSRDEVGELATAFNQMAESLQKLEQLRKTMVVDVAHELRTPLTNIRGYIEALRDGVLTADKETLESLHEETLRLARLVEDLLKLARADASQVSLRTERIDLSALVLQEIEVFKPKLAQKRISVEAELSETPRRVEVDREKMTQVLSNLLDNAYRYTPEGGWLRVRARYTADRVTVTLQNSGEGISQKDIPFIFERFYRGEKSRSRDHGGAGIGLAIVKELVEAHRGQVGAESSPNETTVWFALPG